MEISSEWRATSTRNQSMLIDITVIVAGGGGKWLWRWQRNKACIRGLF